MIRSEREIYQLVMDALEKIGRPMTCSELMDNGEIRQAAIDEFDDDPQIASNKLSDALGLMWRRGILTRYPAPRTSTSMARYAYGLSEQPEETNDPLPPPVKLKNKALVGIVEHDDCVELEFEKFIVYIKPKK